MRTIREIGREQLAAQWAVWRWAAAGSGGRQRRARRRRRRARRELERARRELERLDVEAAAAHLELWRQIRMRSS